ncbi:MAG: hypothetical protein Q4A31_01915 [Corynebacterium sp.]|uniref:hypothetical protein n=1 Tax=Corynebacterium sp. TaxID=1720 RepID=UPI0026DAA269|nr:hypothetical protein [Corynebacterium sp.]MDO4760662.1 hypothetical protein [Corynebacterium sp.]
MNNVRISATFASPRLKGAASLLGHEHFIEIRELRAHGRKYKYSNKNKVVTY